MHEKGPYAANLLVCLIAIAGAIIHFWAFGHTAFPVAYTIGVVAGAVASAVLDWGMGGKKK
jgi:hypothetical protein